MGVKVPKNRLLGFKDQEDGLVTLDSLDVGGGLVILCSLVMLEVLVMLHGLPLSFQQSFMAIICNLSWKLV